ncbi:MAG: AraC family transcriptional regulator [Rhodobacteraceae bacterium]|nr:AraC family transcriptional regulator [Paracoccaceae bacterium]
MSIIVPEIEIVDRSAGSVNYLEHGWPTELCRWHAHEEYELHLITMTRGRAFVGDHIGVFGPGSLYLTGPLLPHNWVTDLTEFEPVEVRDMLVQFSDSSLEMATRAYPELGEIQPLLTQAANGVEFVGFDFEEAVAGMARMRDSSGLDRLLAWLKFLNRLSRWHAIKPLSAVRFNSRETQRFHAPIVSVIDHVVANFRDDLTLAASARMACMSPSSFSRRFKAATGNRYTDFINQVRVGQACVMLYETNDRIANICFDVGFNNLSNFNRQFAKIKGMTPRAYRAEARRQMAR